MGRSRDMVADVDLAVAEAVGMAMRMGGSMARMVNGAERRMAGKAEGLFVMEMVQACGVLLASDVMPLQWLTLVDGDSSLQQPWHGVTASGSHLCREDVGCDVVREGQWCLDAGGGGGVHGNLAVQMLWDDGRRPVLRLPLLPEGTCLSSTP